VLLVLGFVAVFLGYRDYKNYKDKTATGKRRIAKHLGNMMGGTIAVITAVLVVNLSFEPGWVLWLLPTAIIAPVQTLWIRKTLS
jgi:hypothetical protein